jgi:hypothetical protein
MRIEGQISGKTQEFLKDIFKQWQPVHATVKRSTAKERPMTHRSDIRRNPDGSIDTTYYINRSHEIRSLDAHLTFGRLWTGLRAFFSRLTVSTSSNRNPAALRLQGGTTRRIIALRANAGRPRTERAKRNSNLRLRHTPRYTWRIQYPLSEDLPFHREGPCAG